MTITCDRYLAVRFPFKAIAWNIPKKIKRVIVGILLASVLFNIPRFFDGIRMIMNIKNINNTGVDTNIFLHDAFKVPEELIRNFNDTGAKKDILQLDVDEVPEVRTRQTFEYHDQFWASIKNRLRTKFDVQEIREIPAGMRYGKRSLGAIVKPDSHANTTPIYWSPVPESDVKHSVDNSFKQSYKTEKDIKEVREDVLQLSNSLMKSVLESYKKEHS